MGTGARSLKWTMAGIICFQSIGLPHAVAAPPIVERVLQLGPRQGHPPASNGDKAIEELASNIDWLEHELDRWGSVVAKAPDVWGEARLTRYRAEVEEQFQADIGGFKANNLNAAQFVSDQAFLAASFGLNAKGPLDTGETAVPVPSTSVTIANSASSAGPDGVKADAKFDTALATMPFGINGEDFKIGDTLILEQTETLDQKKRYLDHLNELRRLNSGDDISDSPGYGLNLIRVPVSVLPGTHTQEGYGAEITITAKADLNSELLPIAFRDFVINDLVDQLSVPLVQFLNSQPTLSRNIVKQLVRFDESYEKLNQFFSIEFVLPADEKLQKHIRRLKQSDFNFLNPQTVSFPPISQFDAQTIRLLQHDFAFLKRKLDEFGNVDVKQLATNLSNIFANGEKGFTDSTLEAAGSQDSLSEVSDSRLRYPEVYETIKETLLNSAQKTQQRFQAEGVVDSKNAQEDENQPLVQTALIQNVIDELQVQSARLNGQTQPIDDLLDSVHALTEELAVVYEQIGVVNIPSTTRRSTLPFPPSQLLENYGLHELGHVALDSVRAFEQEIVNRQIIHLTDVQGYLREEISSAYDMMASTSIRSFWEYEAANDRTLVDAIRNRRVAEVEQMRGGFRSSVGPHLSHSSTLSLAWCVFLESLLLNERINEDFSRQNSNQVPRWLPFFGPDPSPEARQAFASYVAQRWPLKVFAIDPVVTEQNIADISSVKRQMQLAIAVAVAGGKMSSSAAMQTLRALERDTATIDLNRTVVGFGHGEDTFGWKFYPRFQTPPVQGNMRVFFRDLVTGGPTDKQLLRAKQIEPGMRECVAIVLAPTFVPSISFDFRSNWFKLDKPSHTALSMKETVEYSRSIVSMREHAMMCSRHPDRYRAGELERMLQRVSQLESKLPLQSQRCLLPIENSHGGFEVFSSGTRELAPELLGWYGAPGYDQAKGGTFFLAGDNFSVHETALIVGNTSPKTHLISRQVMQVELPPGLPIVEDERLGQYAQSINLPEIVRTYSGYIDAHVATPYGVSGHLLIPVIRSAKSDPPCDCGPELQTKQIKASINVTQDANKTTSVSGPMRIQDFPLLAISVPPNSGITGNVATIRIQSVAPEGPLTSVSVANVVATGSTFKIDGARAIGLVATDGDLRKSIAAYIDWRANNTTPPNLDSLQLPCKVFISIGSNPEVEVGSVVIDLTVQLKT